MCDAACQAAESLHLRALTQLVFQDLVLGDVLDRADGKLRIGLAFSDRRDVHTSPDLATALRDIALLQGVAVVAPGK